MSRRYAIVNADDFGRSARINAGVEEAYERGIVTSVSLMVRWPYAEAAAAYARCHPDLSVGLHIDLGEWVYRDTEWVPVYRVVDENDPGAVSQEVNLQVAEFIRLMRRPPSHVDGHQHAHLKEPARRYVLASGSRLKVPVRGITPDVKYCGCFYGQDAESRPCPRNISVEGLLEILAGLGSGVTELGCHPAASADPDTTYNFERLTELETLCSPVVRSALAEMDTGLCSFANWRTYAA